MDETEEERESYARHRAMTGSGVAGPDGHARVSFTCGLCCVFAAALHDRTGWRIVAEYENGGEDLAHAWVVDPDGRAVDVNGIHEGGWARTPYSEKEAGPVRSLGRDECLRIDGNLDEDYLWAAGLIEAWPELYGVASINPGQKI